MARETGPTRIVVIPPTGDARVKAAPHVARAKTVLGNLVRRLELAGGRVPIGIDRYVSLGGVSGYVRVAGSVREIVLEVAGVPVPGCIPAPMPLGFIVHPESDVLGRPLAPRYLYPLKSPRPDFEFAFEDAPVLYPEITGGPSDWVGAGINKTILINHETAQARYTLNNNASLATELIWNNFVRYKLPTEFIEQGYTVSGAAVHNDSRRIVAAFVNLNGIRFMRSRPIPDICYAGGIVDGATDWEEIVFVSIVSDSNAMAEVRSPTEIADYYGINSIVAFNSTGTEAAFIVGAGSVVVVDLDDGTVTVDRYVEVASETQLSDVAYAFAPTPIYTGTLSGNQDWGDTICGNNCDGVEVCRTKNHEEKTVIADTPEGIARGLQFSTPPPPIPVFVDYKGDTLVKGTVEVAEFQYNTIAENHVYDNRHALTVYEIPDPPVPCGPPDFLDDTSPRPGLDSAGRTEQKKYESFRVDYSARLILHVGEANHDLVHTRITDMLFEYETRYVTGWSGLSVETGTFFPVSKPNTYGEDYGPVAVSERYWHVQGEEYYNVADAIDPDLFGIDPVTRVFYADARHDSLIHSTVYVSNVINMGYSEYQGSPDGLMDTLTVSQGATFSSVPKFGEGNQLNEYEDRAIFRTGFSDPGALMDEYFRLHTWTHDTGYRPGEPGNIPGFNNPFFYDGNLSTVSNFGIPETPIFAKTATFTVDHQGTKTQFTPNDSGIFPARRPQTEYFMFSNHFPSFANYQKGWKDDDDDLFGNRFEPINFDSEHVDQVTIGAKLNKQVFPPTRVYPFFARVPFDNNYGIGHEIVLNYIKEASELYRKLADGHRFSQPTVNKYGDILFARTVQGTDYKFIFSNGEFRDLDPLFDVTGTYYYAYPINDFAPRF